MKKILLAAAMLSAASGVFAQDGLMNFNECFALTYEGKSIAAGETINVAHFTEADPDIFGDGYVSYCCLFWDMFFFCSIMETLCIVC